MGAGPPVAAPARSSRTAVLVGSVFALVVLFLASFRSEAGGGWAARPANVTGARTCAEGVGALRELRTRQDLARVVEDRGFTTAAELGVQRGLFAEEMLAGWPACEKYYLVDAWKQQDNYLDSSNVDNDAQEENYQAAKARVADFPAVVIMRMLTSEAAKLIPDDSLDFVYVDARHDYCGVKEDLQLYWPKLRPGGIMAGSNFITAEMVASSTNGTQDWSVCADGSRHRGAVRGAAEEFAAEKGIELVATTDSPPTFVIVKPCLLGPLEGQ